MSGVRLFVAVSLSMHGFCAMGVQTAGAKPEVSFVREVAPVLVRKCLSCHNADKSKGGYNLSSFALALRPGDSDLIPITAGDLEKSELFRRITVADEDDRMPQKDDPLPVLEVGVIKRWIIEGARFDGAKLGATLNSLIPREPHPNSPESYPFPIPVTALAFSPDAAELAIGGYHEITIWNPRDGVLLRRIPNVTERVYDLAYNPDGTFIASAGGAPGRSGEVALYRSNEGKFEVVLGNMPDVALSVCFNPDGTLLAAGGADSLIHVYDVSERTEQSVIQQHADWVTAVAFDSTGSKIASSSRDRTARVYSVRDGELLTGYQGHESGVFEIGFNQDSTLVWSAGHERKIHIWKTEDAKRTAELSGFGGDISRMLVYADLAFVCTTDMQVLQYSVSTRELERTFKGHKDWICGIAFDPVNQRLATGSYDGEVRIWNTSDGSLIVSFSASPGYADSKQARSAPVPRTEKN